MQRVTRISSNSFTGLMPSEEVLNAPDAWEILEARAADEARPTLGLDLAATAGRLLFPAFQPAPDLRSAIARLSDEVAEQRPWEKLELCREGDVWALRRRFLDGRAIRRRQEAELGIAGLVLHLTTAIDPDWSPVEVHFQHARPADCSRHAEVLGAAVLFAQEHDSIYLSDRVVRGAVRLRARDQKTDAGFTLWSEPTLSARVRAEIRCQISSGEPRLEVVADALGLSSWTLQRRLANEGEVFSDIVGEMRRDLSMFLLSQVHLPVAEIASMLGYSEPSAFSRVCRRWFGLSPTLIRAGHIATSNRTTRI